MRRCGCGVKPVTEPDVEEGEWIPFPSGIVIVRGRSSEQCLLDMREDELRKRITIGHIPHDVWK